MVTPSGSRSTSFSQSSLISEKSSPPLEEKLQKLKEEYALLQQSQKVFDKVIRNRSCGASWTSCLLCPCTFTATCIPFILCYPCNCYQILHEKETWFDQMFECIGCRVNEPPKNRRELCCMYCTPLFMDLPDVNTKKGFEYYSLPYEMADERNRLNKIYELANAISLLQRQILAQNLTSPGKQVML